jgi:hypothetical protein
MFMRSAIFLACKRPVITRLLQQTQNQYIHASSALALPRRRDFFTSNAQLAQTQSNTNDESPEDQELQKQRRRSSRTPAAPTSLRRVAVEAQRSRDGFLSKAQLKEQGIDQTKVTPTKSPIQDTSDLSLAIDSYRLRRSRTIQHTQSPRHLAREGI